MGVASMVLGIISLVFLFIPPVSLICALLAVIFGGIALSRKDQRGMATAGLVCGLIVICIAAALLATCGLMLFRG